jgi:hypothetical protein
MLPAAKKELSQKGDTFKMYPQTLLHAFGTASAHPSESKFRLVRTSRNDDECGG